MSDPVRIRPEPPLGENRNDKFRRLAAKRTQRVLAGLASLGNLSAANYEYSEEEARQVIAALRRGLDEAERRLLRRKPEKPHFAFE
jgi:hypothetical protein